MCRSLTIFLVLAVAVALTLGLLVSVGDVDSASSAPQASSSWIATAFPVARPGDAGRH